MAGEADYDKRQDRDRKSERRNAGRIIAARIALDKQIDEKADDHCCGR
jgi:hypothetical protein